jgi:hypothetical protein
MWVIIVSAVVAGLIICRVWLSLARFNPFDSVASLNDALARSASCESLQDGKQTGHSQPESGVKPRLLSVQSDHHGI